ncbi:hypothetical protein TrRE_jg1303, partial [Triparma retinervis]
MGSSGAGIKPGSRMSTGSPSTTPRESTAIGNPPVTVGIEPQGESTAIGNPLSGTQPTVLGHEPASAALRLESNSGAGIKPGSRVSTDGPSILPRERDPLGDPPVKVGIEPQGESTAMGNPLSGIQSTVLGHESASAALRLESNSGAGIKPGSRVSTDGPSILPRERDPSGDPPVTAGIEPQPQNTGRRGKPTAADFVPEVSHDTPREAPSTSLHVVNADGESPVEVSNVDE